MCTYKISVNDSLIERVRPAFPDEESLVEWMQQQIDLLLVNFASSKETAMNKNQRLSERLRGIASAPKDFDYKKELETRYEK